MRLISFLFVLLLTSPASAHWKCTGEDRCHDYQNCNWDGQLTWCSNASSSAISFGLKFADSLNFAGGYDVFVEWAFEDEQGEWIELHDQGYALVYGVKTKFWNTDPDCVEFEATDQNPSFGYGECSSGKLVNLFSCGLPPYEFNVLRKGNQDDNDWVAIRQGTYSEKYADATFTTEGSGVCKKAIWSFDHNGPMSISTLGCYGEVIPPENAVGKMTLGKNDLRSGFYCY
jgi:hypothetical protein